MGGGGGGVGGMGGGGGGGRTELEEFKAQLTEPKYG